MQTTSSIHLTPTMTVSEFRIVVCELDCLVAVFRVLICLSIAGVIDRAEFNAAYGSHISPAHRDRKKR